MSKIAPTETMKDQKVRDAKRAFLLGLVDLSWKLASAFLIPVGIGLAIDSTKDNSNTFTIVGILAGLVLAFLVIIQIARNSGVPK